MISIMEIFRDSWRTDYSYQFETEINCVSLLKNRLSSKDTANDVTQRNSSA